MLPYDVSRPQWTEFPEIKLNHWPLVNLNAIIHIYFLPIKFCDWWLRLRLLNCPNMNVTGHRWWSVNIGSVNGLVQSGNKPLPEPVRNHIFVAIWYQCIWQHSATISGSKSSLQFLYSEPFHPLMLRREIETKHTYGKTPFHWSLQWCPHIWLFFLLTHFTLVIMNSVLDFSILFQVMLCLTSPNHYLSLSFF